MIISDTAIKSLVSQLGVMKPATIKDTNTRQLIKLNTLYDSDDYVIEEKIDGCRYMMVGCRFFSTERIEKTDNYPHLTAFFVKLGMANLILDGEINYPGKTSQYCTRVTGAASTTAKEFQEANGLIHYTVWDMLRTPRGTWLINEPLHKRRKYLEYWYMRFVVGSPLEEFIHLTPYATMDKEQFKEDILAAGREGVVLKQINSLYVMGKKPSLMWIKVKASDTADFVIIGYDPAKEQYGGSDYDNHEFWDDAGNPITKYHYYNWIGAIQMGAYVDGVLTQVGKCSGITEELRKAISENKEAYLGKVIKVTYMELTEAGIPRHPRFEEFHEGKLAKECTWTFTK